MISVDSFKQHVEAAQRGVLNQNLDSWAQLGEILDTAGRLRLVLHGVFAAKVVWQCSSVVQPIENVKWESGKLSVEAASLVSSLADIPVHLVSEDFVQLCRTLNKLVKEAYRVRIIAASLPRGLPDC